MRLWDWSLEAYPSARPDLLELQDVHGQSVCLLLWAGWTAVEGRSAGEAEFAAAAELAGRWEGPVIAPLRAARRALKGLAADEAHERAQQAERAAERALIERLEALPPASSGRSPSIKDALTGASQAWGTRGPAAVFERLAHTFRMT